jgi:arabinogalactan endo-1,4-beta-galactosidase
MEPAMTRALLAATIVLLFPFSVEGADYIVGADMSFTAQAEAQGTAFKENNQAAPALQIFKNHGYNWIRLRIFNSPPAQGRGSLPNNLEYTLHYAQEAKKLGYKFLLDFHYADSWADPGKQPIPAAWQGKSHAEMVTLLHDFTRDTLRAFREAGAEPEMVQIGNEITNGMLWPDGRLGRGAEGGANGWDHLADFLKAGAAAVEESANDTHPRPKIMIHIDRGGDRQTTQRYFDKVISYNIPFDVIGQSYYPWWHGSLLDLRENLAFMATTYKKDIVVVECAYNWRPTEYRNAPAPFPETPEGQRAFLEAVNQVIMNAPDNRGKGFFWWEPAVSPRTGLVSRSMFDTEANALPVLSVFDAYTRGKPPPRVPTGAGAGRGGRAGRGRGAGVPQTAPASASQP